MQLAPAGPTMCGGGAGCDSFSAAGTCIPPADDGAICDPGQNLDCLSPAMCVDGLCRFHRPPCMPPT